MLDQILERVMNEPVNLDRLMEASGQFRCRELLDVTIDELGRPHNPEEIRGFELALRIFRDKALEDGYQGIRMNLDLKADTNCWSEDLNDVFITDIKYTMKIVHLCDQVVVRKKGSSAFVMLKDRYGGIQ